MSSEIIEEGAMNFVKLERSYTTPNGCRLATFEEARNGLQTIKENNLLGEWERARLLDGWISGPGYELQMGNDFRGCMASMLVVHLHEQPDIPSGMLYKDVTLSKEQKEVALLLCTEDWNYEVVYWVLNSLSGSEAIDPRGLANFEEMNRMMHDVARKFVEEGPASKKAAKREFSDPDAVRDVVNGMDEFVQEQDQRARELLSNDTLGYFLDLNEWDDLLDMSFEDTWLGEVAFEGGETWEFVADTFWNFLFESFASLAVINFAIIGIGQICSLTNQWDRKAITKAQENFIVASYVLFYSSLRRCEIIHDPLAGNDEYTCPEEVLCWASVKAEKEPERLNNMLQENALWRCYEETGKYEVVDKLLILASKGQGCLQEERKVDILVINRLLECGAKPGRGLSSCKRKTALHYAAKVGDEEVARSLLQKCDTTQRENFVNAKDGEGRTALHRATEMRCMPVCKLLLEYGARVDAQDEWGRTALHYAVDVGDVEIIDCFAPLVRKSDKLSEIRNVDLRQFLCPSLRGGCVETVRLLLDKGEDLLGNGIVDDGKTTLHLAAMCENQGKAKKTVELILGKSQDKGRLVAKRDRRGRTILHEAALKGHTSLCKDLLDKYPDLINLKDKDGRNALYDAVQGEHDNIVLWKAMYGAYRSKGGKLDDVMDRSGLTLLHVALEEGRKNIMKELLLSITQDGGKYMNRADFLGQTALHKAAKLGDKDTVKTLLKNGAKPFQERDCDGRTALHYVVQYVVQEYTGNGAKSFQERDCEGKDLANILLESCESPEQKLLFLWASAAGVGPADQNLAHQTELKKFLSDQKKHLKDDVSAKNLLQIAASIGDTGMTKELLSRGFQITDIENDVWQRSLDQEKQEKVQNVIKELERIAEKGNDQPTIQDNLERGDYAHGLAALLLNPYLKPPIAVGISGDWGKGKSSVMIQTERILLESVAQWALLPSSQLSRSTSDFPGVKNLELTKEGKNRVQEIKRRVGIPGGGTKEEDADPFATFLSNYEFKYRRIFKSMAVMDTTKILSQEQSLPAIITVQYNAWKYRNETEALAGMAVEITKEIEGSMTDPQWLTTCFRNTWRKQKHKILIEIIFPCLLAILLAFSFTWIVWVVFDRYKLEEWAKAKYACVPAAIVVLVWILSKSAMSVLKPVSTQLMNYVSFPDHADKLGYQDRVISDITFLKDEIGRKPYKICTIMFKLWYFMLELWHLVILLWNYGRKLWFAVLSSSPKCLGNAGTNMKFPPASGKNLRIIVFVDDLDRCQESVILQVLAAINLVLAVCEINVVLGMDKRLLERALLKKYGDSKTKSSKESKELADNYLQKIIQLPLDLPDPSEKQMTRFLESHMGMVTKASAPDGIRSAEPNISGIVTHASDGEDQQAFSTTSVSIDVDTPRGEREISVTGTEDRTRATQTPPKPGAPNTSDGKNTNKTGKYTIPIREMLFVTYSSGEWDAICHFKKFATDCRKLPREWKRFLNYHRLVWNIFSLNIGEKHLDGWQVQLISWIFICWEWKETMDVLIRDWLNVGVLKSLKSEKPPSLGRIVEHFIEKCGINNSDEAEDSENKKGKAAEKEGVARREQSNEDKNMTETRRQEDAAEEKESSLEKPEVEIKDEIRAMKAQLLSLEKESSLEKPEVEMKVEMRAMKKQLLSLEESNQSLKKTINELRVGQGTQLLSLEKSVEELKKTINELRVGQGTRQVTPKNENSVDGYKIKQKDMPNWSRLKSALDKYDVSMQGIDAFQKFRFHCVPGHLEWPLPKLEWKAK